MAEDQPRLQDLSDELQKAHASVRTNAEALQKLDIQWQENQSVLKELRHAQHDAKVYKLTGPVLLKQSLQEAAMAVEGRLAFIDKEKSRIRAKLKEHQEHAAQLRSEAATLR